jgi:hypothetical protein
MALTAATMAIMIPKMIWFQANPGPVRKKTTHGEIISHMPAAKLIQLIEDGAFPHNRNAETAITIIPIITLFHTAFLY